MENEKFWSWVTGVNQLNGYSRARCLMVTTWLKRMMGLKMGLKVKLRVELKMEWTMDEWLCGTKTVECKKQEKGEKKER